MSPAPRASWLARFAARTCAWSERWFPEAYLFAVLALALVAVAAWVHGASVGAVAVGFGEGFWSLIPFTMQMSFVIIGGFVTASSPPVRRLTQWLAGLPRSGRSAVACVALCSMLLALLHWGLSLILASLLVRALARRADLRMDYRAAGAAAVMGAGSVWALGLSSSAAQLQANPASMPPAMLAITGAIPFGETIFLWQSQLLAVVLIVIGVYVAWASAPGPEQAQSAEQLGVVLEPAADALPPRTRPGDWLEYSPLPNLLLVLLGGGWLVHEFAAKGAARAIASLNTYNFIFVLLGLLLQWRPRRFLDAVARSVPAVGGVLIQFPIYGGIAAILTQVTGRSGTSLSVLLSHVLTRAASPHNYALIVGGYSALLGVFLPSAGGKWIVEAPYVMQAANAIHYPLGWAVQIYNAAEALPNLINPFWMLPVVGILGLKARDLMGYTMLQCLINLPIVLLLLWALGMTVAYHPPIAPP